jgi:hypothetical protein
MSTEIDWRNVTDQKLRKKLYKKEYCKNNKDVIKAWCKANKDKVAASKRKYYQKNKERLRKNREIYREKNKERFNAIANEYCKKNRDKINLWVKKYRKENVQFKLRVNLRNRLKTAIKKNLKVGSAVSDLGCSISEFKTYLESKFQPGMSWDNYGFYGWHIDHIKPLNLFDLTDRKQFLEACHYTNLQPLWAKDNLTKKKKII